MSQKFPVDTCAPVQSANTMIAHRIIGTLHEVINRRPATAFLIGGSPRVEKEIKTPWLCRRILSSVSILTLARRLLLFSVTHFSQRFGLTRHWRASCTRPRAALNDCAAYDGSVILTFLPGHSCHTGREVYRRIAAMRRLCNIRTMMQCVKPAEDFRVDPPPGSNATRQACSAKESAGIPGRIGAREESPSQRGPLPHHDCAAIPRA